MTAAYIALHLFADGAIIGQLIIMVVFFGATMSYSRKFCRKMTVSEAKEYFAAK